MKKACVLMFLFFSIWGLASGAEKDNVLVGEIGPEVSIDLLQPVTGVNDLLFGGIHFTFLHVERWSLLGLGVGITATRRENSGLALYVPLLEYRVCKVSDVSGHLVSNFVFDFYKGNSGVSFGVAFRFKE